MPSQSVVAGRTFVPGWPTCEAEGCRSSVRDGGLCTPHREAELASGHTYVRADEAPTFGCLPAWWPCAVCGTGLFRHTEEELPVERASAPAGAVPGLDDGHAYLRKGAHDTEEAAAASVTLRSGTQRRRVLQAIVDAVPDGVTDEEGQDRTGLHPNSYTARRLELTEAGYVADTGDRRRTRTGHLAIVWLPTLDGLDALEQEAHT